MYDAVIYDGVLGVLDWLGDLGVTLAVATSKPEHYAVPIVEHLGLAGRFKTICGDTLDGARASKAAVVAEALRRLGQPDPSTVVMVGDRSHDVLGAAAHGVRCYGAGWGYGGPGELAGAGALGVFTNARDLQRALAEQVAGGQVVGRPSSRRHQ
jgi:phosphoglycolate phosphatase